MRRTLLSFIALPLLATTVNYTATTGSIALSGSGTAATLQQVAGQPTAILFPTGGSPGAVIDCSSTCAVRITRNGTPATGTTTPLSPGGATEAFYVNSNASGGNLVVALQVQAGTPMPINLEYVGQNGDPTPTTSITITILPMTGSATITLFPIESH